MEGNFQELEPIVLKRKSNLSQFNVDKNVYAQRDLDYEEEGVVVTDEKFNPTMNLLGSMQNLTPQYDSDRNRWAFYGTIDDLKRIAKSLSLMDEKTKRVIEIDDSSLHNRFDPFWAHPSLYRSIFVEENARYLEPNTPLNELYVRILRGREDIPQPDRTDQSTFDTDRSNLELISPNFDKKKKREKTSVAKKAMQLFLKLVENEDRLKRVSEILNPIDLDSAKTTEDLESLIQTSFVSNDEFVLKYGTTAMEHFINICELSNEDLEVFFLGIQAIRLAVIRVSVSDGYTFKGEKIGGGSITSDTELFRYLKNPNNSSFFLQVESAVDLAKSTR